MVFRAYNKLLGRRPLMVQCSTAATLYTIGDVIAQKIENAGSKEEWNWKRTAVMTTIGGCALGPSMSIWYGYLQRKVSLRSQTHSVVARVFLDQTVFAPVSIVGLYYLRELLQPNSSSLQTRLNGASQGLKDSFWTVLLRNYMLWPGVQYLNFFYVPLQYRLLVSNMVGVAWSAYLSSAVNREALL